MPCIHSKVLLIFLIELQIMNQANVPTIDLQKAGGDSSQLKLLDLACKDHGFFLLKNHGMQKEIDDMWQMSEWFFNQP